MIQREFDFDCLPISRVYVTRIHAHEIQSLAVVPLYSRCCIYVYNMYYTSSILRTVMVFGYTEIIITTQSFGYSIPGRMCARVRRQILFH